MKPWTQRGVPGESRWLIGLTTALLVVTVGRATDLLPFLYGLPLVKILVVLALLAYAASPAPGRPSFARSTIARCVYALVALAVVSVAYSYWRGMSVAVLIGSMAAIVAIVLLVYKTAWELGTLETYLRALVWAAAALTLGGFLFRGEGRLSFGRTYDPNDLAFVLIAVLPITLALWRLARGAGALLWAVLAAGSAWIALLTQSRGGLLGLLLAVSYLGAVGAWRSRFDNRLRIGRLLVGWALLAVLAAGTWAVLPGDAQARFETMLDPTADYNYTAQREGRVAVWQRGLGSLAHVPWGVGVGAYPMAEMARSGYWRTAHNSFLQLGVELGVVGLLVYLVLLARAWRVLGRIMAAPERPPDVAAGADAMPVPDERWRIHAQHLRASLIGIVGAGFFLSQAYALVAFAIYAAIAVLEARFSPRRVRGRRASGLAMYAVIIPIVVGAYLHHREFMMSREFFDATRDLEVREQVQLAIRPFLPTFAALYFLLLMYATAFLVAIVSFAYKALKGVEADASIGDG